MTGQCKDYEAEGKVKKVNTNLL